MIARRPGTRWAHLLLAPAILAAGAAGARAAGIEEVASWDFTRGLEGWEPNSDTASVRTGSSGLELDTTGEDPWVTSPLVDVPPGKPLTFTVRMKSTANSGGQVFYGRSFSEADSVRFTVTADGAWHEYALAIPARETAIRFRLDPATAPGHVAILWIRLEATDPIPPPSLRAPARPSPGALAPHRIASGELELVHYRLRWGGFVLRVGETEVASGHDDGLVGIVVGSQVAWRELAGLSVRVEATETELSEEASFSDTGGARWTIRRAFRPGPAAGVLSVETELRCDRAREVAHVPWLTLFPGLGTHGARKHQGLFAGLEYLSDEPSSSRADLTVPEHVRRVPDARKITFPLMAIEDSGRYVGVTWTVSDPLAAVFDSPDTVHGSGAHLLALWFPAVGRLRGENQLFASVPAPIAAGSSLAARAAIVGGRGGSVVPAVRQYVALRPLPPVPSFPGGLQAAIRLLAAGWLDSDANDGGFRWRHAVWPGFGAQAASDAVAFLYWLGNHATDASLRTRLLAEAAAALEARKADDPTFRSGVSHVQWPTPPLLFGNVEANISSRRDSALSQRSQFDARGVRHYPQEGARAELGSTHFEDHASGYGAARLQSMLEAAALSGSPTLVASTLALLDQQTTLYRDDVPRGAQTWEVPLHTPDILASAHLVKCYVLGYELTGDEKYLEEARYWAWTGVPFVYLEPSTSGEVGPYATIAVLGATSWTAPVWIGLPVQWCGLVYRSWIQRLAVHDPGGPWDRIARGITATGLKMSWPLTDDARRGLLPDFFSLPAQVRDGPAINPGTVQASLAELYDEGTLHGFARAPELGWLVHAPGQISGLRTWASGVRLVVDGWGDQTFRVLFARVARRPALIRSRPAGSTGAWSVPKSTHDAANRWLTVELRGDSELDVRAEAASLIRGDPNESGEVDLSDSVYALNVLFLGSPPPGCAEAADSNDDGEVDLSDPLYALNFLFLGGPKLPEPFPLCGPDPEPGALVCDRHAACD